MKNIVFLVLLIGIYSPIINAQNKQWQIGLNSVSLIDYIKNSSSPSDNFTPISSNTFLIKKINNNKNSAWRFGASFNYSKKTPEDFQIYEGYSYQLKMGLMVGFEKRKNISQNIRAYYGLSSFPLIAFKPYWEDYTVIKDTNNFECLNCKKIPSFNFNLNGLIGLEYELKNNFSVSIESAAILSFNNIKRFLHIYERATSNELLQFENTKSVYFYFKPITYLNINYRIPNKQ